ncbi:MAG: hypothetical protein JW751_08345, partial [Polyangiaceae bacterium]|nr:hypothetical protein [Polyangiaceae bacterium]
TGGGSTGGGSTGGGSTGGGSRGGGSRGGSGTMGADSGGGDAGNGDGGSGGEAGNSGAASGASPSGGGAGTAGAGGAPEPGSLVLLDCVERDPSGATTAATTIEADATWSGLVYLAGPVLVRAGATLTIEPGTQVIAAWGSGLDVGDDTAARVIARGSWWRPIRFCGEQAGAGFWRGVTVSSSAAAESELRHVLVSDAGSEEEAVALEGPVAIENLQVRRSDADGVRAADFAAESVALTVVEATGGAAVLTHPNAATRFPMGGFLQTCGDLSVHLRYGEVTADARLPNVGIPYVQESTVQVRDGAELAIDAGVELRLAQDVDLQIGPGATQARILVEGTETAPVQVRGVVEEVASWGEFVIWSEVDPSSRLSHLELRHGGASAGYGLSVYAAIALEDVLVEATRAGVYIGSQGLAPGSTELSVAGSESNPVTVRPNALVTLPTGGDLTGNATDTILVNGGSFTASGTVPALGIPYEIASSVTTAAGSSMTLSPGVELRFAPSASLQVGADGSTATFVADGTADQTIRLLGAAASGRWPGLVIGTGVTEGSLLDHVDIRGGDPACLVLHSPLSVTYSTFANASYGILKETADNTDYTLTNTFDNLGYGGVENL